MSLTPNWRNRIEQWSQALRTRFFESKHDVVMEGFVTRERLTLAQAMRRRFRPVPAGTAWGMAWEYGWFRGRIRPPAAARGRRLALVNAPGGDSLLWVNGEEHGTGQMGEF